MTRSEAEPLTVVFVIQRHHTEVYGGEKSTIATAMALDARGIRSHFVVTAEDDLVEELRRAGLSYEVVPVSNPFAHFRAAPAREKLRRVRDVLRVSRAIARSVRSRRARVVNAPAIPSLALAWLGARLGGARLVYHVRTASHNQKTRPIEEIGILLSDRTVAVSSSLRDQLLDTGRRWLRPLLAPRVEAIANGFDFGEIDRIVAQTSRADARRAVGPEERRPSLLLVGGIFVDKGQLRFLERVLPAVVDQVPDVHVSFVGGVKDAGYVQACQAAVTRLGLDAHVNFTGYRPQREVYDHYIACDAVVLPSEREGLPRCGVEAQAFARPIVATAVVGSVDAIRNGETGFLVSNDRVELMADPIVRLLRDSDLRLRMGKAGAAHVRESFTLDRNADALARLFRGLASP